MKIRVRYLVQKQFRLADGSRKTANYWQPSPGLRAQGWEWRRLSDDPQRAVAEAEAINAELDGARARGDLTRRRPPRRRAPALVPGSVKALIAAYKGSRFWLDLRDSTKKDYTSKIKVIESIWGDFLLHQVDDVQVEKVYVRLRKKSESTAAGMVRVLQAIYNRAPALGFGQVHNPACRVGLRNTAAKGKLWTPKAIEAFCATAIAAGYPSLAAAVRINAWIGQREGDLLAITADMIDQRGTLRITQSKTGARAPLPLYAVPELLGEVRKAIAASGATPLPNAPLLVSEDTGRPWAAEKRPGKPWSTDRFIRAVRKVRDLAIAGDKDADPPRPPCPELAGLTFRHLRHTAITRLFEAGATEAQIAAVTGHALASVHSILDRYSIKTERLAEQAFRRRADFETAAAGNGDGDPAKTD